MKLKTILIILFLIVTVIPLLGLGIFSGKYYNDKILRILENDLSVATLMQAESINNFMAERDLNITIISEYETVHRLFKPENFDSDQQYRSNQKEVSAMLNTRMSKNKYLVSASIIGTDFRVLASSYPISGETVSELKDVKPIYLNGQLHFTHVIESETGGKAEKVIVIIKGIYEGDRLLGYFVEEMNLLFFEKVRNAVNLFNNGTIYLLDGKGNVITAGSSNESRAEYVTRPGERDDYNRAWEQRDKSANQGILKYAVRGEHYISYYSGIEGSDWFMISSMNVDDILQAPISYINLFLVAFILLVLAGIVVNHLIIRRIVRPLDDIADKFDRIKEEQDYSIRMNKVSNSEIGIIAVEINRLLEHVEEHVKLERQKQSRLQEAAYTDVLTGLYNKRALDEILCTTIDKLKLQKTPMAVLYLDIDDFKDFNTKFGHSGGDKVLCFTAEKMKGIFPLSFRIGGDEFISCVTEKEHIDKLEEFLNLLIDGMEQGVEIEGEHVQVFASIGVAVSSGSESDVELLNRADKIMYKVKNDEKRGFIIEYE